MKHPYSLVRGALTHVPAVEPVVQGLILAATLGLAGVAAVRIAHPVGMFPFDMVIAISPFLMLGAYFVLAYAAASRQLLLSLVGLVLVVLQLVWLSAAWSFGSPVAAPPAEVMRLATANLNYLNPTVLGAFDEIDTASPDVIVLQEVTPQGWAALEASSVVEAYPHRVLDARPGVQGSVILSRWPLEGDVRWIGEWPMTEARVETPRGMITIVNVHVVPPLSSSGSQLWARQLEELHELAAGHAGPLILAGDFNATDQHKGIARLDASQLTDVFDEVGSGLGATWPAGRFRLPLLRLDRVYVSADIEAVAVRTGRALGSDHLPVITELRLR